MGNGVTWCGTVNGKWCNMVWNCEREMVCGVTWCGTVNGKWYVV